VAPWPSGAAPAETAGSHPPRSALTAEPEGRVGVLGCAPGPGHRADRWPARRGHSQYPADPGIDPGGAAPAV